VKERNTKATGLLLLMALTGCVGQGAYDQSLRELQSAKNDLERVRVQNEGLNKQIMSLKESNNRLKEEIEKANAQIALLSDVVGRERQAGESKLKDLERQVKEATASRKALSQELEDAKKRYEDSLKIQKRQAKELKEREQSSLLQPPTPLPKPVVPSPSASPSSPEPPSTAPDQVANGSPSAPLKSSSNLVDINRATPAELTLALELAKEDSDKLVKNRPYKTKEELVTKAGIAKATVDKIKDKITVGP
jgi:competence protein ComEA